MRSVVSSLSYNFAIVYIPNMLLRVPIIAVS